MLLVIGIPIGYSAMRSACSMITCLMRGKNHPSFVNANWEIASAVKKTGVYPGDRILCAKDACSSSWVRLAGLHIVAEIPGSGYISSCEAAYLVNPIVIESLVKIQVKAIVARITPEESFAQAKWKQIKNTDSYVYVLER